MVGVRIAVVAVVWSVAVFGQGFETASVKVSRTVVGPDVGVAA